MYTFIQICKMFKPIITSKKYFTTRTLSTLIGLSTCIATTGYAYLDNVIDSVCPP